MTNPSGNRDQRMAIFLPLAILGAVGVLLFVVGIAWTVNDFTPIAPFMIGTGVGVIALTLAIAYANRRQ